jgi:hypothetical protein
MLSRLCVLARRAGEVNVCLCRPVQIQLEEVEGDYEKHFNELQEKLVLLIQNNQEKVRVCVAVSPFPQDTKDYDFVRFSCVADAVHGR